MIYLDLGGRGPGLVVPEQASLPITDRGFLLGDGLFESMLGRKGSIPLLDAHISRLLASANALSIPCDPKVIAQAATQLCQQHPEGEHAIRLTLSRGSAKGRGYSPPLESRPTLLITSEPYQPPAGPLRAITATSPVNPSSPLCRHKSLSALEKVIARAEAARAGVDEAVLFNLQGNVTEAAAANLFLFQDGRWLTPPLTEGCLPGVMRARLLALTDGQEKPLSRADLMTADAVYLTNALMGCIQLGWLDDQKLGRWNEQPLGGLAHSLPFLAKLFDPRCCQGA